MGANCPESGARIFGGGSVSETSAVPDYDISEMDVLLYGEREALWFADELTWAEWVRSTYCTNCDGRGYFVVTHRSGPSMVEYPTCYVCGGQGRPRRSVA